MNFAFRQDTHGILAPASRLAPQLARIDIARRLEDVEQVWRRFENQGAIQSPYQRSEWATLWRRHVSPHYATTPLLVIGYDADNKPLFLWPLSIRRTSGITIAMFIGGKHATLNLPAWRPDYAERLSASELNYILDQVAYRAPELDLLLLLNQPAIWNGMSNPFALLPHQRAAEDNYRLTLTASADSHANISHGMRRRLRKKENHLVRLPGYRYLRAATAEDVDRCLDAFFVQKAAQLSARGFRNVFNQPGIKSFVRAACHQGLAEGRPVIELHVLEADGELLALFAGVHDSRRYTLAFNSLTRSANARHSPGLVLLQHIIHDCAVRGFEAFDIGPGDVRYKKYFCREYEPVFDSIVPMSARGRMVAPIFRTLLFAKSQIKRSPVLWNFLANAKRRLHGSGD